MAQALPYILGAQAAVGLGQQMGVIRPQQPTRPQTLGWNEAMQRAQSALNPMYDQRLQATLRGVDQQNIQRGFFGQVPGAVLAGRRAADVEAQRIGQVSQLAQQMQGQSMQDATQQQMLAMQWAMNTQGLGQQAGQQFRSGLGQMQEMFPTHFADWFGRPPQQMMQDAGRLLDDGFIGANTQPTNPYQLQSTLPRPSPGSLTNPWAR